jgi:RsiW-degrading membrane proteinase PrsW (M82 family)
MRIFIFLFITIISFAAQAQTSGFGAMANNLMEPVTIVSNFMASASIVIGVTCLFAGLIRYMQYRVNPLANPISTVIWLLVLGVVLLLLPFVYMLTESGIPFKLS